MRGACSPCLTFIFTVILLSLHPATSWISPQAFSKVQSLLNNHLTLYSDQNHIPMASDSSRSSSLLSSTQPIEEYSTKQKLPKIVIFDLDGCIWRPEMYELLHFSGGNGAPFTVSTDGETLLTCADEPVYLLGNVREVMRELYTDPKWQGVQVGISSRTNQPDWARECLEKFRITIKCSSGNENDDKNSSNSNGDSSNNESTTNNKGNQSFFVLNDVFENGPIQISYGSKADHFRRIASETGVSLNEMLFFDNEMRNCKVVSELGVSVAYCPHGVDNTIWNAALDAFPVKGQGESFIIQIQ